MRFHMLDKPDFTMVQATFDAPGEQFILESSAMVARDTGMKMETNMRGGLGSALKRAVLGGETLFQNTFTASQPNERLFFAPGPEGDVEQVNLDPSWALMLQSGAFLGAAPSVSLDTKWGGAKGFFSSTGAFLVQCTGQGPVFFCAYGGLHAVDVGPAGYIVDNTHVVAFTSGLQYSVERVGGMKSLLFSGEGLVCRFRGQGRLWLSTRNVSSLASFLDGFRPVKAKSNS
jgi:uncharacterized protein (TIGR00266 family)